MNLFYQATNSRL